LQKKGQSSRVFKKAVSVQVGREHSAFLQQRPMQIVTIGLHRSQAMDLEE
jgi:hypothetical protein